MPFCLHDRHFREHVSLVPISIRIQLLRLDETQ
jgi:hypothetical protein